tara:strand:- start:776 stop:1204 length:429 start_codon:yes stop_codon:yes gene_type:complete
MNFIRKNTIYLSLLLTTLLLVNCSKEESIGIVTNLDVSGYLTRYNFNSLPQGFVSVDGNNPTKISYNIALSNPNCDAIKVDLNGQPVYPTPTSGTTYNNVGFMSTSCGEISGESTDVNLSISFVAKGITYKGFISTKTTPIP